MTQGVRPTQPAGTSWDSFRPARRFQGLWVGLGVVLLLPGLVLTLMRLFPPTDDAPALVAAFISYAVLTYLASLCCFGIALLRARRRAVLAVLSLVTAALLACHVWWLAPLFLPDDRPPTTDSFSVLTLNVEHGEADFEALARQARTADVAILIETTPWSVGQLERFGWAERFPHSAGRAVGGAGATVLYSRFPVSEPEALTRYQAQQWVATVSVPQLGPIRVIAAHPCNPYCGRGLWQSEHQALTDAAVANNDRPLLVAGDLNAVDDHGPMLDLRRNGLKSATDIVGAGWLPTYPAGKQVPPLLPIDHILVNRFLTATSITRFSVTGTDHLGLLAEVAGARG